MAGLLDWLQTPQGQGLLSGVATYAANARRNAPVNSIGRGLAGGLMGYQSAQDQLLQRDENALAKRYKEMQMQQIERQLATQKRQDDWRAGLPAALAKTTEGQVPFQADDPFDQGIGAGLTQAGQVPDMAARQQYLSSPDSPYFDKMMEQLMPKAPEYKTVGDALLKIGPEGVAPVYTKPEKIDYNKPFLPGGQPNPAYQQYELGKSRAGATRVNVPVNLSTEKKYGEQFAGKMAESDVSARDAALGAPDLASRASRVKQVLSSGKVITGFGADARLQFGKALGLVGASDKETIANTEALAADLARNTLDSIKASSLGSGSGFSNADREFLNKAAGGLITFEAGTLNRLADISYRAAQVSANKWNTRVKQIPQSALEGTGVSTDPVTIPDIGGNQSGWSIRKK